MINPVQTSYLHADGDRRYVIIEPVLHNDADSGLHGTGVYKIYKDAFGEESVLFTEPKEPEEPANGLADENNPDYLGMLIIKYESGWDYEGDLLNAQEQAQIAEYIQALGEPEV